MDRASLIFCGASLVGCLALGAIAFPFVAMTKDQVKTANSTVSAEELGSLNLGDFGDVAVTEMVTYYMENPPEPPAAGSAPKKVRFEGC